MDTDKNKFKFLFILFFLFFIFHTTTFASFKNYMTLPNGAHVFYDHSEQERLLIIAQNGAVNFLINGQLQNLGIYHSIHPECIAEKMVGVTFAFPFFVNLERVCFINEAQKTIDLLILEKASNNSFSTMYWGTEGDWTYFLLNGKPWESSGYLKIRAINKKTTQTFLQNLILQVPGYSGGLWLNGKDFFVTVWNGANEIFTLDTDKIWNSIHNSTTIQFNQVANRIAGPFKGLSLELFVNSEYFLFQNSEYQNYAIHRTNETRYNVSIPEECFIIGPLKYEWFLLCNEIELKKGTFEL